jgi:hypothetical protein
MSREGKKQLSKTRKMSLEFGKAMYEKMEGFVGRRQIFRRATDVVDSDRFNLASPVSRHFSRPSPAPRDPPTVGVGNPLASTPTASESPTVYTPKYNTLGSTRRKHKAMRTDNLVDFVKDFNHEYISRVEAQDMEKRTWCTDMLAFDTTREARIAHKESQATNIEQKFYELEVERTINLGNMTSVLLLLASSMHTLTRFFPTYL